MRRIIGVALLATVIVTLFLSGVAAAASYPGGPTPQVANVDRGVQVLGQQVQRHSGGGLPVTGSDVVGSVLIAVGAIVVGLALHRYRRPLRAAVGPDKPE